MPNNFTNQELNIIDVALMEFEGTLQDELDFLYKDEQATDEEINNLEDMIDTTEDLHQELIEILGGVSEYV